MADRLKSAVELAMERLSRSEGGPPAALGDEQKQQIAEIRNRTAAKLAELEILHKSALAKLAALPPNEALERRVQLQQDFVDERARLERDRDGKVERIRAQAGQG